jgi:pilus assembly protein CpaE
LSLLPHPVAMEDAALIREDHLQRLIGLLRTTYTHLILDLSKSLTPCDMTALRMADVILLVAQLELSSLRNVVRLLLTLGADEQLSGKVKVVLNRIGAETEITLKKAEETIGKPVYWQVPDEGRVLAEARNHGVPLVQHAPRSKAQQSFAGLARALCGKDEPATQERASRWTLFSRR